MATKWGRTAVEHRNNVYRTGLESGDTLGRAFASSWRRYRRPEAVVSVGLDGANALRGYVDRANQHSREWQAAQLRRTGFATPQAELGHSVVLALRILTIAISMSIS